MNEEHKPVLELGLVSVLLRIGVAVLFLVTAFNKFNGGLASITNIFSYILTQTGLPQDLVVRVERLLPYAEVGMGLWLITGIQLRWAWFCSGILMVMLCFGLLMAEDYARVADNFHYLLIIAAGLFFSRYDHFHL